MNNVFKILEVEVSSADIKGHKNIRLNQASSDLGDFGLKRSEQF